MSISNTSAQQRKRKTRSKRKKFQKRVSWLARFILRMDAAVLPHLRATMESDELLAILVPLFDEKLLDSVHLDYKNFCKQVIQSKDVYIKFLSQNHEKNLSEVLLKELHFEKRELIRRGHRKLRKKYTNLINKAFALTTNHPLVLDAVRDATSMNDIADIINSDFISQCQNDTYQQIVLLDVGGKHENHNTILKQILEIPESNFQVFQNSMVRIFEKEINQANRTQEVFDKITPEILRIQNRKNVLIDIVELANLDQDLWGIKIYVNNQGYLFYFIANNHHEVLEVIEDVIEDYLQHAFSNP